MFNKLKRDLQRFMIGRYGNDQLNTFIYVIVILIFFLTLFYRNNTVLAWIYFFGFAILILRSLSKNRAQRQKENRIFLKLTKPFRSRFSILRSNLKDKDHRYYICPQCNAKVRIPSGHGKVAITCPHCRHEFTKRS